jgi:adenine-specific DNA-methyltransferase
MRFIGNKENLVDKIYQVMLEKGVEGDSFFDFFSGTTNVGRFFKNKGFSVYSSDLLYFSFVLQQAYLVNNVEQSFEKLLSKIKVNTTELFATPLIKVVEFLNNLEPKEGFIYKNYTPSGTMTLMQPRMYYSDYNGKMIDAIRQQIEIWKKENLINKHEYYILLACLIETVPFYANVSGVYAAFQKKWDPRALKKIILRPIKYVLNEKDNIAFNDNSANLLEIKSDIYYIDPPYNQRQYAPNYHILETIAKYDNPKIKGVTGLRPYENQKSKFCNAQKAIEELDNIAKNGHYKSLVLSYNSEGIMTSEKILEVFNKYGDVKLVEIKYPRFKSNNNGKSKLMKYVYEQLYILKRYE